jgi:hypothetical protein
LRLLFVSAGKVGAAGLGGVLIEAVAGSKSF